MGLCLWGLVLAPVFFFSLIKLRILCRQFLFAFDYSYFLFQPVFSFSKHSEVSQEIMINYLFWWLFTNNSIFAFSRKMGFRYWSSQHLFRSLTLHHSDPKNLICVHISRIVQVKFAKSNSQSIICHSIIWIRSSNGSSDADRTGVKIILYNNVRFLNRTGKRDRSTNSPAMACERAPGERCRMIGTSRFLQIFFNLLASPFGSDESRFPDPRMCLLFALLGLRCWPVLARATRQTTFSPSLQIDTRSVVKKNIVNASIFCALRKTEEKNDYR